MPQLAYTGLSENWLIKECGHRHWEALAGDAGRSAPDFVDEDGSKS
jgi:probable biosynthetic protein (TIGR04098 family)